MGRMWPLGLALAAGLAMASISQASTLVGSRVSIGTTGAVSVIGAQSAVVGAGREFTLRLTSAATLGVDIGSGSDSFGIDTSDEFAGVALRQPRTITLTDLLFTGPAADISGISLDTGGVRDLTLSNFTFTAKSLVLSIPGAPPGTPGVNWDKSRIVTVTFQTTPRGPATPVPLPGALTLLLPALLAVCVTRRRG